MKVMAKRNLYLLCGSCCPHELGCWTACHCQCCHCLRCCVGDRAGCWPCSDSCSPPQLRNAMQASSVNLLVPRVLQVATTQLPQHVVLHHVRKAQTPSRHVPMPERVPHTQVQDFAGPSCSSWMRLISRGQAANTQQHFPLALGESLSAATQCKRTTPEPGRAAHHQSCSAGRASRAGQCAGALAGQKCRHSAARPPAHTSPWLHAPRAHAPLHGYFVVPGADAAVAGALEAPRRAA